MKVVHTAHVRTIVGGFLFLLFLWATDFALQASAAAPGGVLPGIVSLPQARGSVNASFVGSDGSVTLRGEFTDVNGIPRPGLAKLTPTGQVDYRFRPATVDISGEPLAAPVFLPYYDAEVSGAFYQLSNRTLLYAFSRHILAYRVRGGNDARYDGLLGATGYVNSVFEAGGYLFIGRHLPEERWLEVYCSETLEPVTLAAQETWPKPYYQAAPAGSGRLWVLGRDHQDWFSLQLLFPPVFLFRVEADGTLDPTFDPIELPGTYSYSLDARIDGGFRFVRTYQGSWFMWPSPTSQRVEVDLFNADGLLVSTRSIHLPYGAPLLLAEEADGSLLLNVVENEQELFVGVLVRIRPDGTRDPAFRVELHDNALQVLPDGRIQHSHIHRILPDGTPDPSWQIPRLTTNPDITIIGAFEDGGVVVRYSGAVADPARHPLMLLGPSRQLDPSFQPPADLPPILSCQMSRDRQSVVLVLRSIHEFPDGTRTRVLRLRRDGSIDPDSPRYVPADMSIFFPSGEGVIYTGNLDLYPLSDNGFLVRSARGWYMPPHFLVERVRPDGSLDPDFSVNTSSHFFEELFVLSDDRFIRHGQLFAADGSFERELAFLPSGSPMLEFPDGRLLVKYSDGEAEQLAVWDLETGVDPAYQTEFLESTRIYQAVWIGEGRLIVEGAIKTSSGNKQLVRLHEDGRVDPTFLPPSARRVLPRVFGLWQVIRDGERVSASFVNRAADARISSMWFDPEQEVLLVGGDFTHLGYRWRRGLAWLSLHRITSFGAWLEHLLRNALDEPPSGGDEVVESYMTDYALGVDTFSPDGRRGLSADLGVVRQFRMAINPDADDVIYELEVSENLRDWRPPRDSELLIQRSRTEITVRFLGNEPVLFMRVIYRQKHESD